MSFNYLTINEDLGSEGYKPDEISLISKGKNSRSFLIVKDNKKFLLKYFKDNDIIKRNRLKAEVNFLNLMIKGGFKNVPIPIKFNIKRNWILLSWLDGKSIDKINNFHIKKLIFFINDLQSLKNSELINTIDNASEACFNLNDHIKIISFRLNLLEKKVGYLSLLTSDIYERLQNLISLMKYEFKKISLEINTKYKNLLFLKLNFKQKILSQSDIGFHNIFINNSDELLFFDFEYAGWDDCFKMIADLVLQPEGCLDSDFFQISKSLLSNYINTWEDKERLKKTIFLYRIKWTCILLNNFIYDENQKRIIDLDNLILEKAINYFYDSEHNAMNFIKFLNINY